MNVFAWFSVGLLVGAVVGAAVAALMAAGRRDDDMAELRSREATILRLRRDPHFRTGGDAA